MALVAPPPWYNNTCADLAPKQYQNVIGQTVNPPSTAFATLAKATVLWDLGTIITYAYLPGNNVGTANQQNKVAKYISEWSKYANITFSLVDATATPPPLVRITFDTTTGNWSALGNLAQKVAPSQATMNLSCIADSTEDSSQEKSVILHEFGHALGLTHEYSSSDALDPSGTKTFYASSQGWSEPEVQSRIIDVYSAGVLTNYLSYDSSSIMKNFAGSGMVLNGQDVSPNTDLSDHDKAYMVVNYPRAQLDPTAAQWTLSHALDVVGVPAYTKHAMLLARPDDLRKQFAIWQAEQRVSGPGRGGAGDVGGGGQSAPVGDSSDRWPAWYRKVCSETLTDDADVVADRDTAGAVARAVFVQTERLWATAQDITYSFLDGSQVQWDKVATVIREWLNYANVSFVKVPSKGTIRITFQAKEGPWSFVGRQAEEITDQSKPTMSLAGVLASAGVPSRQETWNILHVFGHALGLRHEHQSPSQGGLLHLRADNVYAYYQRTRGYSRAFIKEQIINVYNDVDTGNYSKLDLDSIMMNPLPREMTLENIQIEANYVLSDIDKAYMVINYPGQTRNPVWTLRRALDVVGVADPAKQSILDETDSELVRHKFAVWNAARRAANAGGVGPNRGVDDQPGDGEKYGPSNVREPWCSAEEQEPRDTRNKTATEGAGGPARGAAEDDESLWEPGETITYFFQQPQYRKNDATQRRNAQQDNSYDTKTFRTERRRMLLRAFDEWKEVSGLKFKEVLNEDGAFVKIFFEERVKDGEYEEQSQGPCSWSRVGRACLNTPNPFWKRRGGTDKTTCYLKLPSDPSYDNLLKETAMQTCRHEAGHLLGLRHEHVSPLSRVHPPQSSPGEAPETSAGIMIWTDWDPHSIMLYRNLRPKDENEPPPKRQHILTRASNIQISAIDKQFVKALYAPDEDTLGPAVLELLGRDDDAAAKVIQALEDTDDDWFEQLKRARKELASQLEKMFGPEIVFSDSDSEEGSEGGYEGDDQRGPGLGAEAPADPDTVYGPSNVREPWCSAEQREPRNRRDKTATEGTGGPARGAAEDDESLWEPGETIAYFFQQPGYRKNDTIQRRNIQQDNAYNTKTFRTERRRMLLRAFDEWKEVSGLKFKEVLNEDGAFVKIFFEERVKDGEYEAQSQGPYSWSRVGRACLNTLNPSWNIRGGTDRTTCYLRLPMDPSYDNVLKEVAMQTCRHETGHLLGLRHEHVSPLSKVHPPQSYPGEETETSAGIMIWTDWDPHSVMLYRNLRSKDDNEPPPKRQNIQTRASNVKISAVDKQFVKALYAPDEDTLAPAVMELLNEDEDAAAEVIQALGDTDDDWFEQLKRARKELASQLEKMFGPEIVFSDSDSEEGAEGSPEGDGPQGPGLGAEAPIDPDTADGRVRTEGDFLPVIIESLKKVFNPGGNQSFTLQFPGRFLQLSQYAWDTGSAGVYGQFIKPIVVNESEFRLTDQLYDVADVVSGPNGISLSQVYDQLVNNLLPVFRSNGLAQQQDQIRQWLLREVKTAAWVRDLLRSQHTVNLPGSMDDSDNLDVTSSAATVVDQPAFAISDKLENGTVNRMELSNALMQEYLQAKQAWEVERDGMLEEALQLKLGTQESASALNSLTRKLAHTTAVREAQLASKYSDAVVRGYSHNVREYVGYLDVKSAAEALQDAKDSLREAAMSSLDGSLKVYPVQMTPIDWFEGLSTSFQLEDLTQDPDLIYQQIRAKSQQLDVLNQQLTALRFGTKGDPTQLRDAVASAQDLLDSAQATLATKYTTNVIAMVKTCYTSDGALDEGQVRALSSKGDLAGTVVDTLINDLTATSAAQTQLTKTSRAYTQALAGYALAQATDTQQQQEQIRLRVESITAEVNELTARYTSLNKRNERPQARDTSASQQVAVDSVPSFPVANDTAGGSRWQQIEIHHRVRSDYTEEHTRSSASSSSMHVNLWLLSASTSQSQSQASSSGFSGSYENDVTVGFRATLVTVDRAGWFQPQFFKQSGSFYHVDPAVSWSRSSLGSQPLLPAFPIGYVICKDITIKISTSRSTTTTSKQNMAKDASASGGVLCFSYSQSSSSSSSDNSYSFQQCSDGCVIRIPGPQILGYIMQHTDPDKTTDMPKKLPSDFFIPDADYDAATQDTGDGAAHGIDNGTGSGDTTSPFFRGIDGILKKSSVSATTMEAVRAAMQKEFEKLSEEVAERVKRG